MAHKLGSFQVSVIGGILHNSHRRFWAILLGLVFAVVLVAGAVYVGRNIITSVQASQQKTERCQAETAYASKNGSVITASEGKTAVAIMGDSYTTGEFLPDRSKGWAYQVGAGKDWAVKLNGVGGTGFVNPGPCGAQAYSDRIARVLTLDPQVLIVEGGLNDANASAADIQAGARLVLTQASEIPKVIVVGPPAPPTGKDYAAIDRALSEAAAAAGRQYVSALDWDLEYLPDGLHLTEASHSEFASNVAREVRL